MREKEGCPFRIKRKRVEEMKKLICLMLVLLTAAACIPAMADAVTPADADEFFEGGSRACRNNITVVDLHGTWYEMGRQYGHLLSHELSNVAGLCEEIISTGEDNAATAAKTLDVQRAQMPYTIRRFFAGMEETSGLTMYQLECANSVERIAGLPRCSFVAAWDDYASGDLVIGRNYDYGEVFKLLDHEVVITVHLLKDNRINTRTLPDEFNGTVGNERMMNMNSDTMWPIFVKARNVERAINVLSEEGLY